MKRSVNDFILSPSRYQFTCSRPADRCTRPALSGRIRHGDRAPWLQLDLLPEIFK